MRHASVVMVRCPTWDTNFQRALKWTLQPTPSRHSLSDEVSRVWFGSQLVNARSLARQSSSVPPDASLAVH